MNKTCIEPTGGIHIYYGSKLSLKTSGNLDIDIRTPNGNLAVENITYPQLHNMLNGTYKLFVRQFSARNSKGFKAEIEFDGQLYSYTYDRPVHGDIQVAEVTLKDGQFTIKHLLPCKEGEGVSKEIWGLKTGQFHKVNLVCTSPNHWGDNNIGTKEYFFMLQDCKTPDAMKAFHVDQLNSELMANRKAIDLLGNYKTVEPTDKQLSGIGFNSTVRDEVVVKVKGSHQRVLKIQF